MSHPWWTMFCYKCPIKMFFCLHHSVLVVTKSNRACELACHEVDGGWKYLSLYNHPIFIFIHYMKENKLLALNMTLLPKTNSSALSKLGKSVREAGSMFGIKKSSVDCIWKRYETSGNSQNLRCPGRPKEVSDRTKRLVVWTAVTNCRKPFCEIANARSPKISESTVRNILAEEGYHRQAVQKVPYLTNSV